MCAYNRCESFIKVVNSSFQDPDKGKTLVPENETVVQHAGGWV